MIAARRRSISLYIQSSPAAVPAVGRYSQPIQPGVLQLVEQPEQVQS